MKKASIVMIVLVLLVSFTFSACKPKGNEYRIQQVKFILGEEWELKVEEKRRMSFSSEDGHIGVYYHSELTTIGDYLDKYDHSDSEITSTKVKGQDAFRIITNNGYYYYVFSYDNSVYAFYIRLGSADEDATKALKKTLDAMAKSVSFV